MRSFISLLIRYAPRKYLQLFSSVGLKFLGIFYAGNAVQCPICSHKYRKFLPYGRINPRSNALCLHCLSLERHRLIWLYLTQKTDFFTTKLSVLHIAPEYCFMKKFEAQHGDGYITADIESPLAKVKMDIHKIPFEANHFDVVLCNHVLEHVANDIQAMSEINRVLKPEGWALLQVPYYPPIQEITEEDPAITNPRDRERLYGQHDHVRKFGKDYTQRIERAGLIAKPDYFAAELAPGLAEKFGLMKDEILFVAEKGNPHPSSLKELVEVHSA